MKVLVSIDLKNFNSNQISHYIENSQFKEGDEIHFVHTFRVNVYADNFLVATYPLEKDEPEIKKTVIQSLEQIVSNLPNTKAKYICDCLFSISPKEAMVKYADDNEMDQTLVLTRKKHGMFSSSFAQYVLSHGHNDLTILREN